MDVKEFVSETLKQITEAIEENESTFRNPNSKPMPELEKLKMLQMRDQVITTADFDIAVTQLTSKEGGAKLSIAGVGNIGGDLASGSETVSRIRFSVPIAIKPKKNA